MANSMTGLAKRTPAESVRTVSLPDRTNSQPLRIDAKKQFLEIVNEARSRLGYSVEAMAANAKCPVSSMADALAGKDGRNFAGHWLVAQGDEFVGIYNAIWQQRYGVSPEAKKANFARELGEMVRRLVEAAS